MRRIPTWLVAALAAICCLAYFAAVSAWMLSTGVQPSLVILFAATFIGSMLTGLLLRALPIPQRARRRR